ncbi:ATP-binding protein [Streptacidiphilus sp. PB12-B1b]|uniref:AAA family ATPase n=1 Tax=Streptacidiphilus sp. PB12-B1b TaxID=2705012 RepID=UPI0015F9BCD0|nr:AAA family ATPase [Streptacidiphilus sp. PB12-B1b]QMU75708.1 ATP-binding protein [Streptacidiphilus sp. PB12-B1b]
MTTAGQAVVDVGKLRAGWRPERLREQREAHGLTLEGAGERLRDVVRAAGLTVPAANFQTLWQHEQGEIYPGPHYRRAYCLLYRATEPELGFRLGLPGEKARMVLTPSAEVPQDVNVLAVERALSQIAPGSDAADARLLHQRILDAWKRRHTGGDPNRPTLVLVGGHAGSGKSEFARFISQLTGWPVLDKDPLTRPLVERLLTALGADPNDRHTALYREQVRPLEYQCLLEAAYSNVDCSISTVLAAPFIAELTDARWMQRLVHRCEARGVSVSPIWIQCDIDTMHEYIGFRSAARDSWKLQHWDDYAGGIDTELRPTVPHLVVDNRLGAAISLTDQARQVFGTVFS